MRIKHRIGFNSVKLYDKQGSVLRAETTISDPSGFKVFRPLTDDDNGTCAWRLMRKGIAKQQPSALSVQPSTDR